MKGEVFLPDGAFLGIKARRALETIFGGKEPPSEDERMGDEEFEDWIRSAPLDFKDVDYDEACRRLAKMYLILLEEGEEVSESQQLWEAFKRKFPKQAKVAGGMTGFMHGWAINAARKIVGLAPAPNPALLLL